MITGFGPTIGFNAGSSTGTNGLLSVLYGAQVSLQVPGFNFLKFLALAYNNIEDPFNRTLDTTYKLQTVWSIPIDVSERVKLEFSGYINLWGEQSAAGGGVVEQRVLAQPQLWIDLGNLLGGQPGWVNAGIEYSYWNNKFGVKGVDDSVVQALLVFKLQ